jgi:hypothetical protein
MIKINKKTLLLFHLFAGKYHLLIHGTSFQANGQFDTIILLIKHTCLMHCATIVSFRTNVAKSKTMSLQGLSQEIDFKKLTKIYRTRP